MTEANAEYLQWLFDEYHIRNKDTANGVAVMNQLAPRLYSEMVRASGPPDTSMPPILSSFQGKSGGTFLHNRLIGLGYRDFAWSIEHPDANDTTYAVPKALELFLRGGCVHHTHSLPHPHTIEVFDRFGVTQIWVHLRDPAESLVSSYYHYRGVGQGSGEVAAVRAADALAQAARLGLNIEDQEAYLRQNVIFFPRWIATWVEFSRRRPAYVFFTYYRELKDDPNKLLRRVFDAFGAVMPGTVNVDPEPIDRIRTAGATKWQEGLSALTATIIRDATNRLLSRYPEISAIIDE